MYDWMYDELVAVFAELWSFYRLCLAWHFGIQLLAAVGGDGRDGAC